MGTKYDVANYRYGLCEVTMQEMYDVPTRTPYSKQNNASISEPWATGGQKIR